MSPLRALPPRERLLLFGTLGGLTALGWTYVSWEARTMNCARWMAGGQLWNLPGFLLMLGMWTVMMVAMMVPSATPMVLTFAAVNRRRSERQAAYVPTVVFLAGYLVVWALFSVGATAAQFWLQSARLLSMEMEATSSIFAAALLIAAGVFQWTPLKQKCLTGCAGPLGFLMTRWRDGRAGALRMGLDHGAYCLGCCWAVMALLFAAGVMNLLWVAGLSLFVLAEKLAPRQVSRAGGAAMVAAGVWMLWP
jgi:predicted metal-binding membrane protein